MFNDGAWLAARAEAQLERLRAWRRGRQAGLDKLIVIELGAGPAIPSVRRMREAQGAPIIRINPRDAQLDGHPGVAISLSAGEAPAALSSLLKRKQPGLSS
ncbi:MAG: hypothetical protein JWQ80_2653 [Massilia sp.]|nr:hypothetical protein [Massilia sp.]